jgi:RNA polymerase sigma-70 factor (ECF subfamily)
MMSYTHLELALAQVVEAARRAWPTVHVSDDAFLLYLAERSADPRQLRTSDLYLACACAQRSSVAMSLFQTHFLGDLQKALARLRPTRTFVEDVRQALIQKLFVPDCDGHLKISDYSGRAALRTWIRTVALRTALNVRRKARQHISEEVVGLLEAAIPFEDAELEFLRSQHCDEFQAAIGAAVRKLSSRDRNLLRMHHLGGMTLEQLATIYRAHRVSVARWLAASRAAILEETQQALSEKLKLSRSELLSLQRAMRSQWNVSLARLLSDPADARTTFDRN